MYKVVDLFSGAGGLSLGFEQTEQFKVVVAVEKHPAAQLTYKANHNPDVAVLDDILSIVDFEEFNSKYGQIDVVIGGPPCQGFSNANRQKFDLISQNNSLVKKYIEFVEKLNPKAFVMENVPMFKSDTHSFYISHLDNEEELLGNLKTDKIILYEGAFILGLDNLQELAKRDVNQYLIENRLLKDLILLIKKTANDSKIKDFIEKRAFKYIEVINKVIEEQKSDSEEYDSYLKQSLQLFSRFIEGEESSNSIAQMEDFIRIQRYFYVVQELRDNNIKYDDIELNGNKLQITVQSITVFDYLIKKLGQKYEIDEGVLNAAWYGAPQMRKRFIAMGVRKDLIQDKEVEVSLPAPKYTENQYRTVQDAIADLETEQPQYEVNLMPIFLNELFTEQGSLLNILRNNDTLHNHIVTRTREHILKRFEQLNQGQNFHDLDQSLVDSYANPARTQNSIYKRLEYSAPSPTVTNVRKSMWIHPTIDRAVSVREAARLQTFPDSFVFKGAKDAQYQQVGNAVPPILANALAEQLINILDTTKVYSKQKEMSYQ